MITIISFLIMIISFSPFFVLMAKKKKNKKQKTNFPQYSTPPLLQLLFLQLLQLLLYSCTPAAPVLLYSCAPVLLCSCSEVQFQAHLVFHFFHFLLPPFSSSSSFPISVPLEVTHESSLGWCRHLLCLFTPLFFFSSTRFCCCCCCCLQ